MTYRLPILLVLLALGATRSPKDQPSHDKQMRNVKTMSAVPLPPTITTSLTRKQASIKVTTAKPKIIIFYWTNSSVATPSLYSTGLVGTTNFKEWTEVVRLPYTTNPSFSMTNPTGKMYYKAFNTIN
jgi:hypothetical protein